MLNIFLSTFNLFYTCWFVCVTSSFAQKEEKKKITTKRSRKICKTRYIFDYLPRIFSMIVVTFVVTSLKRDIFYSYFSTRLMCTSWARQVDWNFTLNFTRMSLNKLIVYQIQFLLLMNYLCGFHGHNCLATAPATLVTTPSSVNLTAATFHLSFCTAFIGFWYNARFVWYAQRWCIAFLWAAFAGFSLLTGEFEKFSVMIRLAISLWMSEFEVWSNWREYGDVSNDRLKDQFSV